MAAAALYGLSRLTPASSLNDTAWFILLGLGLSPSWLAPPTPSWAKAQPRYRLCGHWLLSVATG